MASNISCGGDTFICGLEIYMDGKFQEIRRSTKPVSFEEFTVTESSDVGNQVEIQFEEEEDKKDEFEGIVRAQKGPELVPKCCSLQNEKSSISSQERYTISNVGLDGCLYHNASTTTIVALLAVLVAILTLALFICCANLFWYEMSIPHFFSRAKSSIFHFSSLVALA